MKLQTGPDFAEAGMDAFNSIVAGVTGHRDLRTEDVPRLEERARKFFMELRRNYPDRPLRVLSSLAEGADRLVAKVGLACGGRLIAPLPLPRREYELDFESEASKGEFADLLAKAESWFIVPLPEGNASLNAQDSGELRRLHYAAAGVYIARHCHLLIALWDGDPAEKTGGTSQIVRMRLEGLGACTSSHNSSITCLDRGPVYHILTPHLKRPEVAGMPFKGREILPEK